MRQVISYFFEAHGLENIRKGTVLPVCFDKMGAVVGYGGSLQESCLEGFDFLGLHQYMRCKL